MEDWGSGTIAALCGFAGGIALGFAARWGRFCTLSAIETATLGSDTTGLRMWGLAIAVAILGTFALSHGNFIDITSAFYLASPATLAASIVGGLVFGLGMSLVGTCGYGALARLGGGDLKSLVTFLVMGIAAYATLRGMGAYLRLAFFEAPEIRTIPASIPHFLQRQLGASPHIFAYVIAAALALTCLSSRTMRAQPMKILTGILVGLVVVWGWISTGIIAADDFDPYPLESYTFSAPLGETIIYAMTMSGASLKFGIGATLGVVAGAALTSLFQGHFRWEACDDAREMRRQALGGLLMGFGSVTALGCTIGQGVSAASLLAYSAPITLAAIFVGAWLGLQILIQGSIFAPIAMLIKPDETKS